MIEGMGMRQSRSVCIPCGAMQRFARIDRWMSILDKFRINHCLMLSEVGFEYKEARDV